MSTDARAVIILGSGGHARVLVEALRANGVAVAGYVAPSSEESRLGDIPWLGDDEFLAGLGSDVELVNGIGSGGSLARRVAVHGTAVALGLRFRTVVHPRALVDPTAEIGEGAQILSGAVVGVLARVGADAIVNTAAVVDHDSIVGIHSHVASGAVLAGDVRVGSASHIGMGARVLQGVTIGSSCVVGAGAVVLDDVPDTTTVVGIPARRLTVGKGG